MAGCNWCDINRDDWKWKSTKYNFGDLGKYDLSMAVSDKGILIEFGKENEDSIIDPVRVKINYCPYCGRKLNGVTK